MTLDQKFTNIELYKIWAPDDAMWTAWAKPAMFVKPFTRLAEHGNFTREEIKDITYQHDTMIIVDLYGEQSIRVAIALADLGYRPVPLFNGTKGPYKNIVNVDRLEQALYWGAYELTKIHIRNDANPAFLLDTRRMKEYKLNGYYDNRWCIFPQDMPSADYLLRNQIKKVIVISKEIENDLSHILCRYQEKGIAIYLANDEGIKTVEVKKPSKYKSLRYRVQVILGLRRNSAGGFGGMLPDAETHSSGVGVRGIG